MLGHRLERRRGERRRDVRGEGGRFGAGHRLVVSVVAHEPALQLEPGGLDCRNGTALRRDPERPEPLGRHPTSRDPARGARVEDTDAADHLAAARLAQEPAIAREGGGGPVEIQDREAIGGSDPPYARIDLVRPEVEAEPASRLRPRPRARRGR
jgi:hypothetical protein